MRDPQQYQQYPFYQRDSDPRRVIVSAPGAQRPPMSWRELGSTPLMATMNDAQAWAEWYVVGGDPTPTHTPTTDAQVTTTEAQATARLEEAEEHFHAIADLLGGVSQPEILDAIRLLQTQCGVAVVALLEVQGALTKHAAHAINAATGE